MTTQALIAKPLFISAEPMNPSSKLYFLDPVLFEARYGRGRVAELEHQGTMLLLRFRAFLSNAGTRCKDLPWVTWNPENLDSAIDGETWRMRHQTAGRDPAEGPSCIIWGQEPQQNFWSATLHYGNIDNRKTQDVGHDLAECLPLVDGADASDASINMISFRVTENGPKPHMMLFSMKAGGQRQCYDALYKEGEWAFHRSDAGQLQMMEQQLEPYYDPRVLGHAQLRDFLPAAGAVAVRDLVRHLPTAPDGPPPVTWKF